MRVKRSREENIETFAANHAKEAHGLALVCKAVEDDARMCFQKCTEGARADFCVYQDQYKAIGVQLKTAHSLQRKKGGNFDHVAFGNTSGYGGLEMLLMDFTQTPPRVWMVDGDAVKESNIYIGFETHRPSKWKEREIAVEDIVGLLYHRLCNSEIHVSVHDLMVPTSPKRKREYAAFLWLRRHVPVHFEQPAVEHSAWDLEVDGMRWQAKLAVLVEGDRYQVVLHKGAGIKDGKLQHTQYTEDDFDYLAVQLPYQDGLLTACPPLFYLIPMQCLLERRLAGAGKGSSHIRFYPHRSTGLGQWTTEFAVDVRSRESAQEDLYRIMNMYE